MTCRISEQQLWSWIDREAPDLEAHLAECPRCRQIADGLRAGINLVTTGTGLDDLPLPEQVGPYRIKGILGEGGQAIVYQAEQPDPKRPVALKVLKGGCFAGKGDVRHFQREIQALAALSHPAIATVYDAGRTEQGQHYFAMELVNGVPLDRYIHERNMPLRQRIELFRKVCDGVQHAHANGVIHRDLKPSNILVDAAGNPKILDFGLARLADSDVSLARTITETGQIVGTLRYMSPEQARGNSAAIDARSDVYALGVVLYELITDQPPYEVGQFIPEAVATICETAPRRPSSVNRVLRGDLETIVLKAMDKDAGLRYQSVGELSEDLRRFLEREPILARPPSGLYKLRIAISKHRRRIAIVAVVVTLGLIGIRASIWWENRRHATQDFVIRQHALSIMRDLEARDLSPEGLRTALAAAENLTKQSPGLEEASLIWACARVRAGQVLKDPSYFPQAIQDLTKSLSTHRSPWAIRALLGEINQMTKEAPAADLFAQADRETPNTAEAWYLRSLATLDVNKAMGCAKHSVELDCRHALAWERLAYLHLEKGEFEAASQAVGKLSDLGLSFSNGMAIQGRICLWQHRYEEAIDFLNRAIAVAVASSDEAGMLHRWRGVAQLGLQHYEEAIDDYTLALQSYSRTASPRPWAEYQRATALWCMHRYAAAAADYRAFHLVKPGHLYSQARLFLVLHDQARALKEEGKELDAESAVKEANEVLEAARRDPAAGVWTAKILDCLAFGLTPEELVAGAKQENPREICEGFYYAGEACILANRPVEARKWFQACFDTKLALDPYSSSLDPMSEWHLARWRLDEMAAKGVGATSRPPGE